MIYLQDPDVTIHQGDALELLKAMPSGSVHMACTSPPFYGLRDYGTGRWEGGDPDCDHVQSPGAATGNKGAVTTVPYRKTCGKCGATRIDQQIGLENSPDEWVARLVDVFRELRRVLRDDATLWLELGDSFGSKQLRGTPWKLAFAMQDDGWLLRSEIIWAKPNPMPESVSDRPTVSHSRVFLLTKQARYYMDMEAIREPSDPRQEEHNQRYARPYDNADRINGGQPGNVNHVGIHSRPGPGGRNRRTVWTIPTQPTPEAHFATWPERLVEPMILAGTSERGVCPVCGAPWERITDVSYEEAGKGNNNGARKGSDEGTMAARPYETRMLKSTTTTGWQPTCDDGHKFEPVPSVVLDVFGGSGTTALVARRLGRKAILLELNEDYCALAAKRLAQQSLFADV